MLEIQEQDFGDSESGESSLIKLSFCYNLT